jgi:pimeloyl-ACP methyl ester carboxylesterase
MWRIDVPTLVLWGTRDRALLPCLLDGLHDHIAQLRIERWDDASHWLVHEHPQRVTGRLAAFLRA